MPPYTQHHLLWMKTSFWCGWWWFISLAPQTLPFHVIFFFNLFYFWLCWVFVSVRGLSLVVASGGHSSSWCAGLSLSRPLLLRSTGSRRPGSVVVAHGPSCSAACGIFPDQGSNPCPLHQQADSQPPRHQGSPVPHYCTLSTFHCPSQCFKNGTFSLRLSRESHVEIRSKCFSLNLCGAQTSK